MFGRKRREYESYEQEDESQNFWNSGMTGNREEYEKYLLIKQSLEDGRVRRGSRRRHGRSRTRSGVSLLAFYPGMKLGLLLLLVVNATEVAVAWGRQNGSFLQSAIYWGVASLLIFWYYALRDAGNGSLVIFDHYLGGLPLPRSLPFWAFLLGWVFSGLDLSNFKAWVPWIETVSRWCRYPINCTAFLTMDLPRIPLMVRAFGTILMVGSGCLILLDLFAGRWIGED